MTALSTRGALVRFLHNEGDGGIWEYFDRRTAEQVADALIASGVVLDIEALAADLRAMRPSTDVNRLLLGTKQREDEIGKIAYLRAINDVLDRLVDGLAAVLTGRAR